MHRAFALCRLVGSSSSTERDDSLEGREPLVELFDLDVFEIAQALRSKGLPFVEGSLQDPKLREASRVVVGGVGVDRAW